MMLKQKKSYKKVIVGLIKKQQNSESAVKEFIKRCPDDMDEQFNALVEKVRKLEIKLQKRR